MLKLVSQFDHPQARPSHATPTCGGCSSCCCCCCCLVSTIASFFIAKRVFGQRNSLPEQGGVAAEWPGYFVSPAAQVKPALEEKQPHAPHGELEPDKSETGTAGAAAVAAPPTGTGAPAENAGHTGCFIPIMGFAVAISISLFFLGEFEWVALFMLLVLGLCCVYYAVPLRGKKSIYTVYKALGLTALSAVMIMLEALAMTMLILQGL